MINQNINHDQSINHLMIRIVQEKIKSNPKYLEYLHTHSYWYKNLNRDFKFFKEFESEAKTAHKLYSKDKIERALNLLDTLNTILSTLNG